MMRRSALLPLAALAALVALSACDASNPASPSAPAAKAMAQAPAAAGDVQAQADVAAESYIQFTGTVKTVQTLNPRGQSRFVIGSHTVLTWANGKTAVYVGNTRGTVADVRVGRRALVKGVTVLRPQPAVIANEIRIQIGTGTGGGGNSGGGGGTQVSCAASGANVQVEGIITGLGASSLTVFQQGKGDFLCQVDGGTTIRKGNTSYALAQLQPGWRVHVDGDSMGAVGGMCQVSAREIKVQNTH